MYNSENAPSGRIKGITQALGISAALSHRDTLLYEMPSNSKGKKLCLKNSLLLPSEYNGNYLQKVMPLKNVNK